MDLPRHTPEMIQRYLMKGYWRATGILDMMDLHVKVHPDKEALVAGSTRMTWAECKRWVDRVAVGLHELGLKPGDVVFRQLPNRVEAVLAPFACDKAGIISVSAVTQLRHQEVQHILQETEAVAAIITAEHRKFSYYEMIQEIRSNLPKLKHIIVVGDEVPPGTISLNEMAKQPVEEKYPADYFQQFKVGPGRVQRFGITSGTTGVPKLVIMPGGMHWGLIHDTMSRWRITPDTVVGCFAPYVGAGEAPCGTAFWVGAKVVLLTTIDIEDCLRMIHDEKVTLAVGFPPQMAQMLNHPNFDKYDYSSLECFWYAAVRLPLGVAKDVEEKMGCRIVGMMGAFEASSIATIAWDDPTQVRYTSVGKPVFGQEIKLLDENGKEVPTGELGEIRIRGAGCASGYYKNPEATAAAWRDEPDGWVTSGDLGRFDEAGNLYIVGREKDMINRGGRHIFPAGVEVVLASHPNVLDAVIVAMPDPIMGEKACAYVILKPGQQLSFDEMVSFLQGKEVATYKLPERLEIVGSFPMGGDGQKILKRELSADIARKLKEEGVVTS